MPDKSLRICVQGLWHLGAVTIAGLSTAGYHVLGLDFDATIIKEFQAGKPPIFEPRLAESIEAGVATGRISFTSMLSELPHDLDLLWVTYDTPVEIDDHADTDFVARQIKLTLPTLPPKCTILISSQMPVGSIRQLESYVREHLPEKELSFACSPENLRLGKALDVFLHPDRIIVGVRSASDQVKIQHLLQPITDKIEWMSVESAEMTKHAINSFLATSVVFANEIATLCEVTGADSKEVERGLKSEHRIGPKAYLSPGAAFAGGTLARDVEFLKIVAAEYELSTPLLTAIKISNDAHKLWVRRKLSALFPRLDGLVIAVWGLTYKPETDTLRRSLSVELCDWLVQQKAKVRVHDSLAKILPREWNGVIQKFDDPTEMLKHADVLVIGTEHAQYKHLATQAFATLTDTLVVLDANRFLKEFSSTSNIAYFAVGSPEAVA